MAEKGTVSEQEPLLEISSTDSSKRGKTVRLPYTEHLMTVDELNDMYGSRMNVFDLEHSVGLDPNAVVALQAKHGRNEINPPPSTPLWLLFIYQFGNLFMVLLLAAAFLCFCLWLYDPSDPSNLFLAGFLFIVVVRQK